MKEKKNQESTHPTTRLYEALKGGDEEQAKSVVQNNTVESLCSDTPFNQNPFRLCVKYKANQLLERLLAKSADRIKEEYGGRAIVEAVKNGYSDSLEYLLQHGVRTKPILHVAVDKGYKDCFDKLVRHGNEEIAYHEFEKEMIESAAKNKDQAVLRYLLNHWNKEQPRTLKDGLKQASTRDNGTSLMLKMLLDAIPDSVDDNRELIHTFHAAILGPAATSSRPDLELILAYMEKYGIKNDVLRTPMQQSKKRSHPVYKVINECSYNLPPLLLNSTVLREITSSPAGVGEFFAQKNMDNFFSSASNKEIANSFVKTLKIVGDTFSDVVDNGSFPDGFLSVLYVRVFERGPGRESVADAMVPIIESADDDVSFLSVIRDWIKDKLYQADGVPNDYRVMEAFLKKDPASTIRAIKNSHSDDVKKWLQECRSDPELSGIIAATQV